jgi:hypothetical protein
LLVIRLVLACLASVTFGTAVASAQTSQGPYARVAYHKVAPGAEAEFEAFMRDTWKRVYDGLRQKGQAVNWMLFRVHLAGANDEYNYVSVSYHDSWAKTEAAAGWAQTVRAESPANAATIVTRTRAIGPVVRQALYGRVDFVLRQPAERFRYAVMDFMKVKDGMIDLYMKVEREDWKPLHQVLTNDGNRVGWVLWDYMVPGGTGSPHDFMTAMLFTDYAKIKAANDAEAYTRAHPSGNLQTSVADTRRARDVVRTEIWEVVESLD